LREREREREREEMNTGYQGFVPYGFRRAESRKPGDVQEFKDNKFRKVGVQVASSSSFLTTTKSSGDKVKAHHYASSARPTPLIQLKDRKKLESKKFLAVSASGSSFLDPRNRLRFLDEANQEKLLAGFQNGSVSVKSAKEIFRSACDPKMSADIRDTFDSLLDKRKSSRESVSWDEFRDVFAELRSLISRQLQTRGYRHTGPAWVQDREEKVCTGYVPKSSAQIDVGLEGSVPAARAYTGTTEDLFEGTSKVTNHIPGYCGYIAKKNPNTSEKTRESRHNMFAVDEYKFNMTGYTGNPRTNLHERGLGSMMTTNSRAEELVKSKWGK
jgi:hypothetical protein